MREFERVMQAALESLARGERVALATVVSVRGSAPRHAGARMLVWEDGRILGTVGGATLELRVIEHAREALAQRRSRLERYVFSTQDDPESVGLCGGAVEVFIEVLEPEATLYILGAGHVARPLARMADLLGMQLMVIDDRAEYAQPNHFPAAARVERVEYDETTGNLAPLPVPGYGVVYAVVATWGWDEPALDQILRWEPPPAYIGLVASKTKARVIRERLLERRLPQEAVATIRAPVGLDLGAETPEEIALAILAEVLMLRKGASGAPLHDHGENGGGPE